MKSIYSAVRTGSLNKAVCASSSKGYKWVGLYSRSRCVFVPWRASSLYLLYHHLRREEFSPISAPSTPPLPSSSTLFQLVHLPLCSLYIFHAIHLLPFFMFYRHCTVLAIDKVYKYHISMCQRAFFNSIIDKHQHMHFFTFKTVLV